MDGAILVTLFVLATLLLLHYCIKGSLRSAKMAMGVIILVVFTRYEMSGNYILLLLISGSLIDRKVVRSILRAIGNGLSSIEIK